MLDESEWDFEVENYISTSSFKGKQAWGAARAERFKEKIYQQLSSNGRELAVTVRLATSREFSQNLEDSGIDVDQDDYWIVFSEGRAAFLAGDVCVHQNAFEGLLHALENDRRRRPDNVYVLEELHQLVLTIQSADGEPLLDHEIPEFEMSDEQIKKIVDAVNAIPAAISTTIRGAIKEEMSKPEVVATKGKAKAAQEGSSQSWWQTATICGVVVATGIGCVVWWNSRLDRVEDQLGVRISTTQSDIKEIHTLLKDQAVILGRIDERTSGSDTHSSTPPTTTSVPPTP